MKILVIAPTPFFADRGTHIRILEEALALEKLGHQITIATYHIGKDIQENLETQIDVRRIRRLLFWYKKLEAGPDWQKIILDLLLIRKIFTLAREKKVDILYAHLHEGVMLGWIVQKLFFWRKLRLICDFHGGLTSEMVSHGYLKAGILKKIFLAIEKFINNRGDYAITSSWENTAEIQKVRKDGRVKTVLDGVNLERYVRINKAVNNIKTEKYSISNENTKYFKETSNVLNEETINLNINKDNEKLIVTYAGALIDNKGIEHILQAISIVKAKTDKVHFVLAGFPPENIKKSIEENDWQEDVTLISPLSYFDLPGILRVSDVAIDPKDSVTQQASGKILQYMAASLPVICFDRQNNHNYLQKGAFYAKDISAEGIAEGIFYFLENPLEIEAKGRFNRKRVKKFSWKNSGMKIDKIISKVCKS